jgi:UDP-N-acetylmuramoylalanine--D-glutamate ligase
MTIQELREKKVGVLGLGVNHAALVLYLLRQGIGVTVRDQNPQAQETFSAQYPEAAARITWQIQPDVLKNLDQFDVVFRTPSISALHSLLQKAARRGLIVYSQTRLFFDLCPCRIIGISGTKGKGTTATLLATLLQTGYSEGKTYLAGNIGQDPFAFLPSLQPEDLVILELSSFQLEDLQKSPYLAILLNITPDHLTHHKTFSAYQAAKLNLISHQGPEDMAILYGGNPEVARMARFTPARTYVYSLEEPARESAWVAEVEGEEVLYVQLGDSLESFSLRGRKLLGKHNLENIIPAVLAAALLGVPMRVMEKAVRAFTGLPHRLEYVGSYDQYVFYDDSMATTPEAAIAAIQAMAGRRVHLIAGGKDKGSAFTDMARFAIQHCVTVSLLPGSATAALKRELRAVKKKTGAAGEILTQANPPLMPTILSGIQPHLQPGDIVLLAPGCASDKPFANYHERGSAFRQAVEERYALPKAA